LYINKGNQIQNATIMEIQSTELMRNGSGEMILNAYKPAASKANTFTRIIMILISVLEMKWYRRACSTFPFV
jgi:hypothetical protein